MVEGRPDSGDFERGFADGVMEERKRQKTSLSREEIEAALEAFEESDLGYTRGESGPEVVESARAKLRAWLGQQNDV